VTPTNHPPLGDFYKEIVSSLRPDAFTKIVSMHNEERRGGVRPGSGGEAKPPDAFHWPDVVRPGSYPCSSASDTAHTPRRFALWEIHPVYAMDVCEFTTKAKCRVDHDTDWVAFKG